MNPFRAFRLAAPGAPVNPLRGFWLASFAVVAGMALVHAVVLSHFLRARMVEREAQVTADFVRNILKTDRSAEFLMSPADRVFAEQFHGSVQRFDAMPDVFRINAYSLDGVMLWSSDQTLIGRRFSENEELEEAGRGNLVVEWGRITATDRGKPEHMGLNPDSKYFVETYIPVPHGDRGPVVGVVEIYKAPVALSAAINAGYLQAWITALAGGAVLYFTLIWFVRRADRIIRRQHERLVESRTLALVGELAPSVAHNMRNPLSSIRSSAELALEMGSNGGEQQARDIIAEVDRIDRWIRELLLFARSEPGPRAAVDAERLLRNCFSHYTREFERRSLQSAIDAPAASSATIKVKADETMLGHVLHSLIANAIEATPEGGAIVGQLATKGERVAIRICDNGRGIAPSDIDKVLKERFTTKPRGLGFGLTLARRAVEHFGGEIRVDSAPGGGTAITVELPAA